MGIEIYEQDKYAIHVVNAKGEIKYECSARNVAEAIVKEHNKHDGEDQWHVGATVTLVSAKNIAWRAEALIDWDKVKTGKNTPNKCVKVTASETQTNLQESKPKVSATYLLSDGDKPENYMRWHATRPIRMSPWCWRNRRLSRLWKLILRRLARPSRLRSSRP